MRTYQNMGLKRGYPSLLISFIYIYNGLLNDEHDVISWD